MRRFFIPTANNNYHAFLLRRPMLALYLLILIILNLIFGSISLTYSKAAIDFSKLYELHNSEREKRSLGNLSINPLLINSATAKAEAMVASNCWSHYCPNGKSPWDFFDESGYVYVYAGENLAEGFSENAALMTAWLDSPTHRENILNNKFTEIGIGYAYGEFQGIKNNTVVVVHFGSRNANVVTQIKNVAGSEVNAEIKISEPKNGTHSKDNRFNIVGSAANFTNVEISANNINLGSVPVTEGIFTYRPTEVQFKQEGTYELRARGVLNAETITSEVVNILIDKTPPTLQAGQLVIKKPDAGYVLEAQLKDAATLKFVNANLDFSKVGDDFWQLYLEEISLPNSSSLKFSTSDAAGNATTLEIRKEALLDGIVTPDQVSVGASDNALLNMLHFKNQTTLINFSFLILMSSLFGLDYIVLQKTGETGKSRTHSHLNALLFIAMAIIVLLAGTTGNILSGLGVN